MSPNGASKRESLQQKFSGPPLPPPPKKKKQQPHTHTHTHTSRLKQGNKAAASFQGATNPTSGGSLCFYAVGPPIMFQEFITCPSSGKAGKSDLSLLAAPSQWCVRSIRTSLCRAQLAWKMRLPQTHIFCGHSYQLPGKF